MPSASASAAVFSMFFMSCTPILFLVGMFPVFARNQWMLRMNCFSFSDFGSPKICSGGPSSSTSPL